MKNGANRTNKIRRNYKIKKTGRAELPTEINAVRQRPEKKKLPKNPRREKVRAGNLDRNQASSRKTFLRDFTS